MGDGNKMNIFQLGLLAFFGLMAVVGAIAVALNESDNTSTVVRVPIVIWVHHLKGMQ